MPATPPRPALRPAALARLTRHLEGSGSAPPLAVRAPWTGEVITELPATDPADVAGAAAVARQAQTRWAREPVRRRCEVLRRFRALLLTRREDLLDLLQTETGKARLHALEEVLDVAGQIDYYTGRAEELLASRPRAGVVPGLTQVTEHRHPKGLIGVIAPFNYPLTLSIGDAIPALLAGNGVLCKPAPQTPLSILAAVDLLVAAGLPRGLLTVVTGDGAELGRAVTDAVDHVSFTGSSATGAAVAAHAGSRLIGFTGELGGKNPLIVLDDADPAAAAHGAAAASFANTGQLCVSPERLYATAPVYAAFVDALVERASGLRLGPGYDWDIDVGSLTTPRQLETVTAHVADARARGARVLVGGRARPDLGPLFYEPTVLEGVTPDMAVCTQETFGPVVAVYRVADAHEAVMRANEGVYGLSASVWGSPAAARRVATQIRAGAVNINDGYAAALASHDAPMGGMGASGVGRRHGSQGLLGCTEPQTVATQRLAPLARPAWLEGRRYAGLLLATLGLQERLRGPR